MESDDSTPLFLMTISFHSVNQTVAIMGPQTREESESSNIRPWYKSPEILCRTTVQGVSYLTGAKQPVPEISLAGQFHRIQPTNSGFRWRIQTAVVEPEGTLHKLEIRPVNIDPLVGISQKFLDPVINLTATKRAFVSLSEQVFVVTRLLLTDWPGTS